MVALLLEVSMEDTYVVAAADAKLLSTEDPWADVCILFLGGDLNRAVEDVGAPSLAPCLGGDCDLNLMIFFFTCLLF